MINYIDYDFNDSPWGEECIPVILIVELNNYIGVEPIQRFGEPGTTVILIIVFKQFSVDSNHNLSLNVGLS